MAGRRIAIQGFGNVGRNLAVILADQGASIVAASDSNGGVFNPDGLDVGALVDHKREKGVLAGFRRSA